MYSSGTIKCWGSGSHGQLGNGKVKQNIGDEPGEMGSNLTVVKLGGGHTATAVSAGDNHTCAILDNDAVKCWGNGEKGRLGQGNEELIGDEAGEIENLPTVNLGDNRTAKAISAGAHHTCALLDNDEVKCWGLGKNGRLGQGNTSDIGDGKDEIKNLAAINLGTGRTAKAISAGLNHTCAILDNDTVKCWGSGGSGKLGYGDTARRGMGPGDMGDNLPEVNLGTKRKAKAISTGASHTCALLDNNTVQCFGFNGQGQLGSGNTDNLGDSQNETGDSLPVVDLGF